jgi:hypothetical protein
MASKTELLKSSGFVTIHLVLAPTTLGITGAAEMRRIRPSAFLIDTSRAAIVDQAALVQALEETRVAGAGLYVFDTEPLPTDHAFQRRPTSWRHPISATIRKTIVEPVSQSWCRTSRHGWPETNCGVNPAPSITPMIIVIGNRRACEACQRARCQGA